MAGADVTQMVSALPMHGRADAPRTPLVSRLRSEVRCCKADRTYPEYVGPGFSRALRRVIRLTEFFIKIITWSTGRNGRAPVSRGVVAANRGRVLHTF
jgi:hypothetical protein